LNKKTVDVNLAVYMERLDTYIETQEKLNTTLCQGLERVHDELDELKHWRTKFYGAKSLALLTGILFGHAAVVMAAVVGLITLYRD
tara:strand:+ start:157 stop:414 length:258 start_codon:yes stop_codon:yes gene_type:complete